MQSDGLDEEGADFKCYSKLHRVVSKTLAGGEFDRRQAKAIAVRLRHD